MAMTSKKDTTLGGARAIHGGKIDIHGGDADGHIHITYTAITLITM